MVASNKDFEKENADNPIRVLFIDDEADTMYPSLAQNMEPLGFTIFKKTDTENVVSSIHETNPDVILLDLHFPGDELNRNGATTGGRLLHVIHDNFSNIAVVLFTTRMDDDKIPIDTFIVQPHGRFAKSNLTENPSWPTALSASLQSAIDSTKLMENLDLSDIGFLIGKTARMQEVAKLIYKTARSDSNVLIYGESGTGKELVAEAIHKLNSRRMGPFEKVNCSGVAENILDSDLFGHEKGAFTSAIRRRLGYIELANNGTLFLDEIQDMPISLQNKLMIVIEKGIFRRMGGVKDLSSNFRLITATNKKVSDLVKEKRLRHDFAFRLSGISINLPPLRDRLEDLPALAEIFLKNAVNPTKIHVNKIRLETINKLKSHSWPGNIRELKITIERAVALTTSTTLLPEDIFFDNIVPIEKEMACYENGIEKKTPISITNGINRESSIGSAEYEEIKKDNSAQLFTDKLEVLPLEDRYKFLVDWKDKELRKEVLTEFARRLRIRIGKKVSHKILAENLYPGINAKKDYDKIRKFVNDSHVNLAKLEWNK